MIHRFPIMAMSLFCLCVVTGCVSQTPEPSAIDFFDAYHHPDLPREEWPAVPEVVKKTHSWDRIPRYLAISKNQEKFGTWTEEELSALAAHDIIQLSTPTELADRRDLAAELKRRNPDLIILGYRNLVLDYASMDGERFQTHPDWYLKERKTGEYAVHGRDNPQKSRRPVFDLRNPEVREWWVQDVNDQLNLPNFDGVLIDAFAKAITPWGRDAERSVRAPKRCSRPTNRCTCCSRKT